MGEHGTGAIQVNMVEFAPTLLQVAKVTQVRERRIYN